MKTKFALILLMLAPLGYSQTYNETLGDRAGDDLTTGDYNVIIGDAAGTTMNDDSRNVVMGYRACVGTLDTDPDFGDEGDGSTEEVTTAVCDPADSVIIGYHAGIELTGGNDNVIIGAEAGTQNSATDQTMVGNRAGHHNTSGFDNTFIGEEAGFENIDGDDNTFVGEDAGFNNTTADDNTAVGATALRQNEIGRYNTAVGKDAGYDIGGAGPGVAGPQDAVRNTVVGQSAGIDIGGGVANTCIGDNACPNTEHADFNTFVGMQAGYDNNRTNVVGVDNGQRNTGLGMYAGYTNRTGSDNVWIGAFTDSGQYLPGFDHEGEVTYLQTGIAWGPGNNTAFLGADNSIFRTTVMGAFASAGENDSIAIGYNSRADNVGSIAIGVNAEATFTNSMTIGNDATAKANNSIVIGNDSHTVMTADADSATALGSAAYRYADVVTNQVSVNATSGTAARIEMAADAGAANDDVWTLTAADGGDFTIASFATGADVNLFSIDNTGDATLAGDLTLNSDRRLKKDIESIDNALALISDLRGKTYHWKDSKRGTDKHYGLIAQDVEAYMPELVGEDDNGMKTVNYQGLVPVLVSAVNQVQQDKQQLENRVLSLEEKLERQAAMIEQLLDRMD